ncbi:MAG: HNH/ENDO VII family nuclease, partial [Planctomycetota bacterium]
KASALEEELATRPHAPGVSVVSALEPNVFRDTAVGRVAAGIVGDPAAVVTQPFNEHGAAVNPLTGEVLSPGALEEARVMTFADIATAGLARAVSTPARGAAGALDEIADVARRGIDDVAAPVADDVVDPAADALRGLAGRNTVVESPQWSRTEVLERTVYQRDELIDPDLVDVDTGLTNLERMENGLPPIGADGLPVNLHHVTQTEPGPLVEVTGTFHQENFRALHQYTNGWDKTWRNGADGHRQTYNSVPEGIDRTAFDRVREAYWAERALDFGG